MPETFDFQAFVESIKSYAAESQVRRAAEEMKRIQAIVVREPSAKFRRQMYLKRLDRLGTFLRGEEIGSELTPSESEAYRVLQQARQMAAAQATAAAAQPSGIERRRNKRIKMKTVVRIRREGTDLCEILEPGDISKGGLAVKSKQFYVMGERVRVVMHYRVSQPVDKTMEQLASVVRIVPGGSGDFSYGLEFEA